MKKYLIVALLINISIYAYEDKVSHHVPQNAQEHGPDIPIIGSSYFDKIFSKTTETGKIIYDVPYPLKNLLNKFPEKGTEFVHTLIPFSRSLQRPLGNRYDPLLNPRLVITPKDSKFNLTNTKIFIGYVKKTDQIEVISFNDEAGRFEYQLVTNYSKSPNVFYVNRGKCLTCHQGQAPIFSVKGWEDTSFGPMKNLLAAKLKIKEPHPQIRLNKITKALYGEIPSTDDVRNFDNTVRLASAMNFQERLWNIGCGTNNSCRLGLLLKALTKTTRTTDKYFRISTNEILSSKLVSQNFYHSFLSNTDIGSTKVIIKYLNIGNGDRYENTANNPKALLEIINNIYNLSTSDNPTTIRKDTLDQTMLLPRKIFAFSYKDKGIFRKEEINVEAILLKLFKEEDEIFEQTALNKPLIMFKILESANSKNAKLFKSWAYKKGPKKVLYRGVIMPLFKRTELNTLSRHCYQCHATGLAYPPQFLIGTENEVLGKITTLKSRIEFKISSELMPPSPKARELLINSGDKEAILKFVKNLKKRLYAPHKDK